MVYRFQNFQRVASRKLPSIIIILGDFAQKEKYHVMDYHRNSSNTLAAGFPGWEYKPKITAYRQLDPYFARYRGHPGCFERVGYRLAPSSVENRRGSRQAAPPYTLHEQR